MLTDDFKADITNVFKKFAGEDMELDCNELMLVMHALGQKPREDHLKEMVAKVDEDGSGVIELEEFFTLMEMLLNEMDTPEGLSQAF